MKQVLSTGILILLLFSSCVKELDGPNTLAPEDQKRYGTVVIYTDWDFKTNPNCTTLPVELDGEPVGHITLRLPVADCYESGALTLDSVIEGEHFIYAGCDTVGMEARPMISIDVCNRVKLSLQ